MDGVHGRTTIIDDKAYRGVRDERNRQIVPGKSTPDNPSGLWGMALDNRAVVTNSSYDFMFNVGHGNGQLEITSAGNRVKREAIEKLTVSAEGMQQQLLDAGLPPEGKVSIMLDDFPPTQVTIEIAKLPNGNPYMKDVTIGSGNTQVVIDNPGDYSAPQVSKGLPRNQEEAGVTISEVAGSTPTSTDGDKIEAYIAIDPNYMKAIPPPLDRKNAQAAMEMWRIRAELFQFGQGLESTGVSGDRLKNAMIQRAKDLRDMQHPKLIDDDAKQYRKDRDKWVDQLDVMGTYEIGKNRIAKIKAEAAEAAKGQTLQMAFDSQTGNLAPVQTETPPQPLGPDSLPKLDAAAVAAIFAPPAN